MSLKRAGGLAAVLAALSVVGAGCGPLGESDDDKAKDAAAAYRSDLEAFASDVQDAAKEQFREEDDSKAKKPSKQGKKSTQDNGKGKKDGKDKEKKEEPPTPLELAVAEPPELPAIESDEPSYVTAQQIAERLGPMVDELDVLAQLDQGKQYYFNQELETKEYGFGADVISRSTDYLFNPNVDVSVFGSDDQLAGLAKDAISKEVREWTNYRRRFERIKASYEIFQSYKDYELEGIDYELAIFKEYEKHLRQVPSNAAQLAYFDDVWPDEDPLRLGASGTFNSLGEPYFKSLLQGERVIRSMADDVTALADAESVDQDTPYVGDAYRDAIVAGYVPPRDKYKYRVAQVGYRAWMLYRIRELEDTPEEAYDAAEQTIYLELLDDSRNTYNTFLSLLAGFNDSFVIGGRDVPKLKSFIDVATTKLAGTYPPILDPTRRGLLRALDTIDLDLLDEGYGKIGNGINALGDAFDARDEAQKQYDQAKKKIEDVLKRGAKEVDSTKKLKASLKEVIAATRPGAEAAEEEATQAEEEPSS